MTTWADWLEERLLESIDLPAFELEGQAIDNTTEALWSYR
jgi:hypothetical protein